MHNIRTNMVRIVWRGNLHCFFSCRYLFTKVLYIISSSDSYTATTCLIHRCIHWTVNIIKKKNITNQLILLIFNHRTRTYLLCLIKICMQQKLVPVFKQKLIKTVPDYVKLDLTTWWTRSIDVRNLKTVWVVRRVDFFYIFFSFVFIFSLM